MASQQHLPVEKPFIFQERFLHPELQEMINDAFYIVGQNELDKYNKVSGLFMWNVNGEVLDKFPSVKVVGSCSVGYDKIDMEACKSRGIRVGNTPGTLDDTTADMAFTLLLATARKVCEGDRICKDPLTTKYDSNWFGFQVSGKVLGIVGMGRIGAEVAKRAKGFSMPVLYHNRHQRDSRTEERLGATYVSLPKLLEQSDFVVVVVPGIKENVNLFGEPEFAAMKSTGIFINISRGIVVDQDALIDALSSNKIAAAGLDVTYPEPLPRDHALLQLPNVTLTPHTDSPVYSAQLLVQLRLNTDGLEKFQWTGAGSNKSDDSTRTGSATLHTRKRMVAMTIQNILTGIRGEPMPSEVFD